MADVITKDLCYCWRSGRTFSSNLCKRALSLDTVVLENRRQARSSPLPKLRINSGMPNTDTSHYYRYSSEAVQTSAQIVMANVLLSSRIQRLTPCAETSEGTYHAKLPSLFLVALILTLALPTRKSSLARVFYRATCDVTAYGKQVFVIGGGNAAVEESQFLPAC